MLTRTIPSSGEQLPVIGLGTWQVFDVGPSGAEREPLAGVLHALVDGGGRLIDSSPMYRRAEGVAGDLVEREKLRRHVFVATKVWTKGREDGIAQMERSMALLRSPVIDLMQIHNLLDWKIHLATLRTWKEQGRIRYIGITHYRSDAHADLEAIMRAETIDFVQVNYAIDDRAAEKSLLPLAQERGIAVLVNRPFGEGGLLRKLAKTPLPAFAAELGCKDWSSLALKYLCAHEAVTCIIPATSKAAHMAANAAAGSGVLPDAGMKKQILTAAGT
jgi:diketogulonate reductase-like aldo/keto reductase